LGGSLVALRLCGEGLGEVGLPGVSVRYGRVCGDDVEHGEAQGDDHEGDDVQARELGARQKRKSGQLSQWFSFKSLLKTHF